LSLSEVRVQAYSASNFGRARCDRLARSSPDGGILYAWPFVDAAIDLKNYKSRRVSIVEVGTLGPGQRAPVTCLP
jgi:hypothetical protein